MKWVTRERPKIDRIACPWLITRFIDGSPEFLYVPAGDVLKVAQETTRRQTAAHPFGTLKAWMGSTHFLTRTLPRVSTEMCLNILAYDLKCAMRIFGISTLVGVIGA